MPGRRAPLATLLVLAACGHAGRGAVATAPGPATPAPPAAPTAPVRYFHGSIEQTFWVSRAPDLDRVIAHGARLELRPPDGEVIDAAWDAALSARNEPLVGALDVPARLGGGFVFWSRLRVFRGRTFTGPLEPVALGVPGEVLVRGVRAGLSSVIVLTEAGLRELLPGSARCTALKEPALVDFAALSPERAARLDLFGRAGATDDGGASYRDLSRAAGAGVRKLAVGPGELWIDAWEGRFLIEPGGKLAPADPPDRGGEELSAYQTVWKGGRERDDWPWSMRQSSPLGLAVASGGALGDGTAVGAAQGAVVRVELATGRLLSMPTDWFPQGLACEPVRAPDALLFACVWERYQGYGGYVLRWVDGARPELEKAFSDDGSFVGDGEGALGFVGACQAEPRFIDTNDPSRYEMPADTSLRPVLCVRRGPGEWVERHVDPGEGASLVAWVPRRDGTAAALALSGDPLPPPAGALRVVEQGGVRLVRIYPETPGWTLKRPSWQRDPTGHVDRRFQLRDDGSIDGWLSHVNDSSATAALSVTFDPSGVPAVHDSAPGMVETITGGAFAVAIARDGALHETTDHGRTWRAAGRSPVPPGLGPNLECSALGCTLGPALRLGWGDAAIQPRVSTDPFPSTESVSLPRLACAPRGAPVPLAAPPPAPPGNKRSVSTGWGDTLEIVRDASAPEPPPPPGSPGAPPPPPPPPPPTSARAPKKPPHASPAVLRTHTLLMRAPFSPFAAPRRLNATDASFNVQRRTLVVPLLTPAGDVDLLLGGDQTELLVSGDKITVLPAYESRRYGYSDASGTTGIELPGGHALLLGEVRRRLALEDHGPAPPPPPLFLGLERGPLRKRAVTLARRDDGTTGVIVVDGGAPEVVGVALIDRLEGTTRPPVRLAPWSTALTADDPRCKKGADPLAWRALLVIDPATWLALDERALPGITLGHQGLLLVRWGTDRVCLEAMDAAATETRRRGDSSRSWNLVARWGGEKDRGAALRTANLRQELVCRIEKGSEVVGRE